MNDDEMNIVQKVILDAGGYTEFSKRMGLPQNNGDLRRIAAGERIPTEMTRRRIVRASRGRLTEADIIALSGKTEHDHTSPYSVDPMWDADEDERRRLIARRASAGAKRQLRANARRKR